MVSLTQLNLIVAFALLLKPGATMSTLNGLPGDLSNKNANAEVPSTSAATFTTTVSSTTTVTSTKTCIPKVTVTVTTDLTTTVTAQSVGIAAIKDDTEATSCALTVTKTIGDFTFATVPASAVEESLPSPKSTSTHTSTVFSTDATTIIRLSPSSSSVESPLFRPSFEQSGAAAQMSIGSMSSPGLPSMPTNFATSFWSNALDSSPVSSTISSKSASSLVPTSAEKTTTVKIWSTETVTIVRSNNFTTALPTGTLGSGSNSSIISNTTSACSKHNSSITVTTSSSVNSSIATTSQVTSGTTTSQVASSTTTSQSSSLITSTSTTTSPAVSECYDSNINQPTPCTASSNSLGNGPTYSGAITSTLSSSNLSAGMSSLHMKWLKYLAVALALQIALASFS